jgi:hypothetical protein
MTPVFSFRTTKQLGSKAASLMKNCSGSVLTIRRIFEKVEPRGFFDLPEDVTGNRFWATLNLQLSNTFEHQSKGPWMMPKNDKAPTGLLGTGTASSDFLMAYQQSLSAQRSTAKLIALLS